jgi:8-oxo-dGTP pyrophosphatase MutT (NUDIX family)
MGKNPQDNGTAAAFATLRQALDDAADMPPSAAKTAAIRYLAEEVQDIYGTATALRKAELLHLHETDSKLSFAELGSLVGLTKARAAQILNAAQKEAAASGPPSDRPERPVIVSSIVTSGRRVLISRRRNEPDLPWAFIGGEIEPGESPADAAVREVKEETGLRIAAGEEIGRRIHPRTGRWIVYIAATPQGGTDAFVGDTEELAEVRWVTPAEADKLTDNTIYEPVRVHLRRMARRNGR